MEGKVFKMLATASLGEMELVEATEEQVVGEMEAIGVAWPVRKAERGGVDEQHTAAHTLHQPTRADRSSEETASQPAQPVFGGT